MIFVRRMLAGSFIVLLAMVLSTHADEPAGQKPAPLGKGLVTLLQTLSIDKKLTDITDKVLSDPEIMRRMTELAEDEQVRDVLNDPEVAKALDESDYVKLLSNPKVLALTRNKKLMELVKAVAAKVKE